MPRRLTFNCQLSWDETNPARSTRGQAPPANPLLLRRWSRSASRWCRRLCGCGCSRRWRRHVPFGLRRYPLLAGSNIAWINRFVLHDLVIGPVLCLFPVNSGTLDGQVEISGCGRRAGDRRGSARGRSRRPTSLTSASGDQQCQPRGQRQPNLPVHGILLQSSDPLHLIDANKVKPPLTL